MPLPSLRARFALLGFPFRASFSSSGNRAAGFPAASVLWLCRLACRGLPRVAIFRVALCRFRLPRSCFGAASDVAQGCPCSSVSGLPAILLEGCPSSGILRRLRPARPQVALLPNRSASPPMRCGFPRRTHLPARLAFVPGCPGPSTLRCASGEFPGLPGASFRWSRLRVELPGCPESSIPPAALKIHRRRLPRDCSSPVLP